jgi:8-oxo-dGTP diphosphatase
MKLVHLLHCQSGDGGSEWLGAFFLAQKWSGEARLVEVDKHDRIGWYALDDLPAEIIAYTKQGIEMSEVGVPFSTFGWP